VQFTLVGKTGSAKSPRPPDPVPQLRSTNPIPSPFANLNPHAKRIAHSSPIRRCPNRLPKANTPNLKKEAKWEKRKSMQPCCVLHSSGQVINHSQTSHSREQAGTSAANRGTASILDWVRCQKKGRLGSSSHLISFSSLPAFLLRILGGWSFHVGYPFVFHFHFLGFFQRASTKWFLVYVTDRRPTKYYTD
jgi:hypothetical protein